MKKYILFLLIISTAAIAFAQKEIPAFGKVDKADLEMKDCDFDKGAIAVKLIDWGNTYYDRGTAGFSLFKTVFEKRTRIKILKEKGLSEADVKIPYYSRNNDEKFLRLTAYTYNIDATGNVISTEVKKNSIYPKKIDADYSEMIIAFPEVKVGSIIEYRYTMQRETMGQLRDWFFQGRIPVKYSEYQMKIPQIFRFSVQPSVIDPIEDKQEVIDERISVDNGFVETKSVKSNYIMRNLPGIKDEPFMGSPKDYMQRLEFQLSQIDYGNGNTEDLRLKWSDVIKDLLKHDNFGKQLEKNIPGAASIIEEAKRINDEENKMKFIFNQVRKNISWNGEDYYIYTENGITKTWETKTGNVADINLLLVKLLSEAGLKALPMLFSTRDHGLVTPYYPFLNQFNSVMAYVQVREKYFVLDATDKISNYKLIPEQIVNTKGFLIEGENGRWKDVLAGKYKYKVMAAVQGEIDSAGIMKGTCLVNCNDYARKQRCEIWQKNKEEFKQNYFSNAGTALKIEDFTVNNAEADSLPLEQKVKFSSVLNSSGNYKYFTVNLFADLDKNPFVADERIADIDFGFQQDYIIFGNYSIPQDYVFDVLPENISMIMPDTSIIFTRSVQADENLLNVRITLEFKRSFYAAANYPVFKEFYKKLFAKLNEQIVIKKK
ncbi:DUF3857 domain-containing protein [Ferruginibacter sp.]